MLTGGHLFVAKEDVTRKFSMGSRLCHGKNNHLRVIDDNFNRPASRSHSVDNSLVNKADMFRDSNSTCSAYSERSYSSISSIEKENLRKLSVSSDARSKFGRFLTPSPKRHSNEHELTADMCPFSLDFVQEVGHFLDPAHRQEDPSEPRVPQVPCFQGPNGRRGRSPQPPWERMKKRSVFSPPHFLVDDQICEANEPTSPSSEHEFNLIVPELGLKHASVGDNNKKAPNCKIS